MHKLMSIAISSSFEERTTAKGIVKIENLRIHFTPAVPRHLPDSTLSSTYRSKPLVVVNDEILFGELAILRYLQMDGWDGVWVDTFHGRVNGKLFWSSMPPNGFGSLTEEAMSIYNRIVQTNGGKSSGFFDVFAWKNGRFVFLEYKGKGDSSNLNETRWIDAALKCDIRPEDMFFVTY
jgi:hypothetical protein